MDEKEVSEMQEEMMTVLVVEPMKALKGQLLQSLNVIYLAERTTFTAIFSSFKRTVSIRYFRIFADNANRLNQLNMLYARACT